MFEVFENRPDGRGRFGEFGGRYVPEILMPALLELEEAYAQARADKEFSDAYLKLLNDLVGRPGMLTRKAALREIQCGYLPEAGRPQSHWGAQDQSNTRPGAVMPTDGSDGLSLKPVPDTVWRQRPPVPSSDSSA